MQSGPIDLVCHPSTPSCFVEGITVTVGSGFDLDSLDVTFIIFGDQSRLSIPPILKPCRADELWRTTCFEVFIGDESLSYQEFNFSPSGQWAAYGFDRYREGMRALPIEHPFVRPPSAGIWEDEDGPIRFWGVGCDTGLRNLTGKLVGLSAIIEESDGNKSYWALNHPPGPPDFHHKDCFALKLTPPERA